MLARPLFRIGILSLAILGIFSGCCPKADPISPNPIKGLAQLPELFNSSVSIVEFGAVSDGETVVSKSFARAIDSMHHSGGGKIIVPKGLWITGPIELKSNINLHLDSGAVILFSKNLDDYPLIMSYWEGKQEVRAMPLIYAKDAENIAITGNGIIDGSGQVWRPVKKNKLTDSQWKSLISSGGVVDEHENIWWPNQGALDASKNRSLIQNTSFEGKEKYKAFLRPTLVNLVNCNKVLLEGPTFQNSPGWCIHPLLSKNLTFRHIHVRNPWNAQNGDGIDIESCRYVTLVHSTFDVGDDGICLKSGKDEEGRKRGVATEDVEISDCIVYHGHGGFVVGSEMSGGVRNITIKDCTFMGTDVGLRFKSNRQRGGVVENIHISNIRMADILASAIDFNLYYAGLSVVEQNESGVLVDNNIPPVSESTPQFKKITINNVICNGAQMAIYINGLPEMPVQNMQLNDVFIQSELGCHVQHAKELTFQNVVIKAEKEEDFIFHNTSQIKVTEGLSSQAYVPDFQITGPQTRSIEINYLQKQVKIGQEVNPDEVRQN